MSRSLRHAIRQGGSSLVSQGAGETPYSSTEAVQASDTVRSIAVGIGSSVYDRSIPGALTREGNTWGSGLALGLEKADQLRSGNPMLAGTVPWSSVFVRWQTDMTALSRVVAVTANAASAWNGPRDASKAVSAQMLRRQHVVAQKRREEDMRVALS